MADLETTDKMPDRQVATTVREHFLAIPKKAAKKPTKTARHKNEPKRPVKVRRTARWQFLNSPAESLFPLLADGPQIRIVRCQPAITRDLIFIGSANGQIDWRSHRHVPAHCRIKRDQSVFRGFLQRRLGVVDGSIKIGRPYLNSPICK